MKKLKGRAFIFGDNIDTEEIIPSRILVRSRPEELAQYCLRDVDPEFTKNVQPGDMIVAGKSFGIGSGWSQAAEALKKVGVSCIVARSFGRIFYRNAINMGLPILECPEAFESVNQGDELEINFRKGKIANNTKGETYQAKDFPPLLEKIIDAGGLMVAVNKGILK